MLSLYKYQSEGVDKLIDIMTTNPEGAAMLCDPPGAGKTPQAISVMNRLDIKPILIVCPASLRDTWRKEIERWSNKPLKIAVMYRKSDAIPPDVDVIIISFYLILSAHEKLSKTIFGLLVVDESHF